MNNPKDRSDSQQPQYGEQSKPGQQQGQQGQGQQGGQGREQRPGQPQQPGKQQQAENQPMEGDRNRGSQQPGKPGVNDPSQDRNQGQKQR